jgi:DNA-binding NtrC family response regulator
MPDVLILVAESDPPLLHSQKLLFESGGFQVLTAESRRTAEQILAASLVDGVVIGHSLSQTDREVLVAQARLIRPEAQILVLHASGGNQPVPPDAAVDSRDGAEKVLDALHALLGKIPPQPEIGIEFVEKKQRARNV